ncbi:MAG: DUF4293 domain-containing protein [Prevotella sp.]|nr:DUF4293 domain-containing protein [Candidatus Prevotella equi]
MWQRKQTIYLVLVVILMIAVCFMTRSFEQVCAGIVGMHAIATIMKYENRKKQMRQCRIGIVMCLVLIGMFALDQWYSGADFESVPFYLCLEVVSIILYEMAYRGVKHDDDLVRSADRIR